MINQTFAMDNDRVSRSFGKYFPTIDFQLSDSEISSNLGKKTLAGKFFIGNSSYELNVHELYRIVETAQNAIEVLHKSKRVNRSTSL